MNQLKSQHVYVTTTPQHRIILNQLNNSNIANYFITAPYHSAKINNPEWHYVMMTIIGKTITTQPALTNFVSVFP